MSTSVVSFVRDFSNPVNTKFFQSSLYGFREVTAAEIVSYEGQIVTHDYWMGCHDIFLSAEELPRRVIELDDFEVLASKDPEDRRRRETSDIIKKINFFSPLNNELCTAYNDIFYGKKEIDEKIISRFHDLLLEYYIELSRLAYQRDEFLRYMLVEVPSQYIVSSISVRGIPIDGTKLTLFRQEARHDYYTALRNISDQFDVPIEVPTDKAIERIAIKNNVDIEEYSLDFIMNYLPQIRNFSQAVLDIRELDNTKSILDGIAVKNKKVHPIMDVQGSRTSRVLVRNPYIQNLAKKYRSLICPGEGKQLCYVDYDQFEVGIMAALSGDAELHKLYAEGDMYEIFRNEYLNGEGSRKGAKILFLAYAYGMKLTNLPIVGVQFDISRKSVRTAFKRFTTFETWKRKIIKDFESKGYVSTSLGNRFYAKGSSPSKKERLSAISQVVQGEGSLIFKKALIAVSKMDGVEMLLPMHDALLFQYEAEGAPKAVVDTFIKVMTDHFEETISGKASIESFSDEDIIVDVEENRQGALF